MLGPIEPGLTQDFIEIMALIIAFSAVFLLALLYLKRAWEIFRQERKSLNHAHSIRKHQTLLSQGGSRLLRGEHANNKAIRQRGKTRRAEGRLAVVCYRGKFTEIVASERKGQGRVKTVIDGAKQGCPDAVRQLKCWPGQSRGGKNFLGGIRSFSYASLRILGQVSIH